MGGTSGWISGTSKIQVYLDYIDMIEGWKGVFNDFHPDPDRKKYCKSMMTQDPETGEWVLPYHLHT